MNRLTDDKTAADLKDNIEGFKSIGYLPAKTHERYVRLAEYERTGFTPEEINELYRRVNGAVNVLLRGKVGRLEYILSDLSEPPREEEE